MITPENVALSRISVIDVETRTVVATIPVGTNPITVAQSPDGRRLYVTDRGDDRVSVIDTIARAVVATIPTGERPVGIVVHPDGSRAYVVHSAGQDYQSCTFACLGYVSELDTGSNTVSRTTQVGLNLHQATIHLTFRGSRSASRRISLGGKSKGMAGLDHS